MVIGMGESKTPMPFIKACEQFKTLDVLYEGNGEEAEKQMPRRVIRRNRWYRLPA